MSLPVFDLEGINVEACPAGANHRAVGCSKDLREDTGRGALRCGFSFQEFYLHADDTEQGTEFGMYLCQKCGLFYAAQTRHP